MTAKRATPTELIARARALEADARWAEGHDREELMATAKVLRKLAKEAMQHGVVVATEQLAIAANDNIMPITRGKEVA